MSHFEKILPELAKLQWSHLSLLEMEAVESEIIEELDSLRQFDTTIGHMQISREYSLIEKQFALLLDACECLFKLSCVSSFRFIKQHGKDKEAAATKTRNKPFSLLWFTPFKNCTSFYVDTEAESG